MPIGESPDLDLVSATWPIRALMGVMDLVYVQLAGSLFMLLAGQGLAKSHMFVVSRQDLYTLRQGLPDQVLQFLRSRKREVFLQFKESFQTLTDFQTWFNGVFERNTDRPITAKDMWDINFRSEDGPIGTLGEIFEEIAAPDPDRERIHQTDFGIGPAEIGRAHV